MLIILDRAWAVEGIMPLTTYKDIKNLSYIDVGNKYYLVEHIQDYIRKYRENSGAYGIYSHGKLVGAISVTDHTTMSIFDKPLGVDYINPVECSIIQSIVVDRKYTHKGYGTKLILYIIDKLIKQGKKWLYADMIDERLLPFYEKIGFYRLYNNIVVKHIA